MNEKIYYTKVYDWIAQKPDLTLLEKLIICNVLRFKENGCYESYRSIGRKFGITHSAVIKAVKSLIGKEWLCVLYEGKYKRILYVVPERLKAGPLFEQSGYYRNHLGNKNAKSGNHRDHVVKNVVYNREKNIINNTMEIFREEGRLSKTAREKNRQKNLEQVELMKEGKI